MGNSDSSGQADEQEGTVRRQVNKMVITVGIAVTLAIVAAVYLAFNFVEEERGRNIQAWQVRLGIVADSRTSAVNEWVDENFGVMRELSENASLQVYMTQLTLANGRKAEITDEDGQAGYLRNLLISTANRAGYIPPPTAGDVAANVEKAGVAGLALADASGNFIVSTPSMPPVSSKIRKAVLKALGGEPALIDVFMGSSNLPSVGFVLPIFSVQGDEPKGIGAVIGIRLLGKDLFNKLKQPDSLSTFIFKQSIKSVTLENVDEKISYDKYLDELAETIKDKKTQYFYKNDFKSLFFNKIRGLKNNQDSIKVIPKKINFSLTKKQNFSFFATAINHKSIRKSILIDLLKTELLDKNEIAFVSNLLKDDVIHLEKTQLLIKISNEGFVKLVKESINSQIYQLFPYSSPKFDPQLSYEEVAKSLNNLNTRLLNLKKINKSLDSFVNDSNQLNWDDLQSINLEILDED